MKANTYRSRKAKGTRLEKKFAQLIREKGLDDNAKRMVLSGGAFGFETDIFTKLPWAFEVKNQEKIQFWQWWEQAEEQRKPFKPPALVFSANFRPIMIALTANDFLELLVEIKQLNLLLEDQKKSPELEAKPLED